jgi:hypothetical protein
LAPLQPNIWLIAVNDDAVYERIRSSEKKVAVIKTVSVYE